MATAVHMDASLSVSGSMVFRPEFTFVDHQSYMEKRQLFLRSYQFCRKQSVVERIKLSLIRVKRVVWVKLRSARRLRRLVWFRLRYGRGGGRRFHRLTNNNINYRSSRSADWAWSSLW